MKTLFLIAITTLSINAQSLVSADGVEWQFISSARDKDGAKFNVFARRVSGDRFPALEVRFGNDTVQAEHDCKKGAYRVKGGKWAKPGRNSVGAKLVRFACGM